MSKAGTRRQRRKRRAEKGRRHGPNRGSSHRLKSGRTGTAHTKRTPSKKHHPHTVKRPRSLAHLDPYRIER